MPARTYIVELALEEHAESTLIHFNLVPDMGVQDRPDDGHRLPRPVGASHGRWLPAVTHLMRDFPADPSVWRRFFPVPIEFGSEFN